MANFKFDFCSTFVPSSPFRLPKFNTSPVSVTSRNLNSGCQSRQIRHARGITKAELTPCPNDEADWVVVDILVKGNMPSYIPERLITSIEDDSKSLLRIALKDAAVELSVLLCTDAEMRALNLQWRGKDTTTDVLSFPQDDPDRVVLGDIAISVETANEQASERGLSLRDEIRVLLVHGLLHLMGYDHEGTKAGDWMVVS